MGGEVLVVDLLYHQDRKVVALARVDYWSHPPLHLHPRYSRAVLSSLLVKQNIHAIFCGLRHLLSVNACYGPLVGTVVASCILTAHRPRRTPRLLPNGLAPIARAQSAAGLGNSP